MALVSLGIMVGPASVHSVGMQTRTDFAKVLNFCEPIRAEGCRVYRGWPIPWVSSAAVDDYDGASDVFGFALDVVFWFWMVSIPQVLGLLTQRLVRAIGRWRRRRGDSLPKGLGEHGRSASR